MDQRREGRRKISGRRNAPVSVLRKAVNWRRKCAASNRLGMENAREVDLRCHSQQPTRHPRKHEGGRFLWVTFHSLNLDDISHRSTLSRAADVYDV